MRTLLIASAAISALALGAAQAQESAAPPPGAPAAERATDQQQTGSTNPAADTGAAAGGVTGAAVGAVVGGPVGAVIGGFAGAMIGSSAAASDAAVEYAVANPVEPVTIEAELVEGAVIPEAVTLHAIPDDPELAYVYVDGRPVIVRQQSREIVYSPGYVVPEQTVVYVRENPVQPVAISGVAVGEVIPADVELVTIPSDPAYAYVYTDTGPVLVNQSSRTVVWVQ